MSNNNRYISYAQIVSATHSASMTSSDSTSNSDAYSMSIDSNTHPLYLHNNDQPGMILISKKLVGSENYVSWKRSMQIALSAKNKLAVVNGEFPAPDEKSTLYAQWKRVNDMIITWILNTVAEEISNSMNYLDTARDVWDELNERFSAVSGHKFYETQKALFRLEQENESVEMYFHKLKGFWDEIKSLQPIIKCTCGANKEWDAQLEKTKLIQFLMGLHNSYTAARGQLLMMHPWPSVNQAFMLIKQEERQRQNQSSSNNSLAMMVNLPKSTPHFGQKSGQPYNSSEKQGASSIPECSYCHGKNHVKDKCYKLVGYPIDHPYHPNNKGKRRPFNKSQNSTQQSGFGNQKVGHAFQASDSADVSPVNTPASNLFSQQMAALQTQMNSLMQSLHQGPSTGFHNPFTVGATNIAGPTQTD